MMLGLSCLPWRRAVRVLPLASVHDFTQPMEGWFSDPIPGLEECVYAFTLGAGFQYDSIEHLLIEEVIPFTSASGFVSSPFDYMENVITFTSAAGFQNDDVETTAPNDTPTTPATPSTPTTQVLLELDVSGITAGSESAAASFSSTYVGVPGSLLVYAKAPASGLSSPVGGLSEWQSGLTPAVTRTEFQPIKSVAPAYTAAGIACGVWQYYMHFTAQFSRWPLQGALTDTGARISAPRSEAVWGEGIVRDFAAMPMKYGEISGLPSLTPSAWLSLAGTTIDVYLPNRSAPLSFSAFGSQATVANAVRAALAEDGLNYSVGVRCQRVGVVAGFLTPESDHAPHHGNLQLAIYPMLLSGTFRFKVHGIEEYSTPLDLLTCTKAEVQAAISAMPSIIAAGGMTVRSIARPANVDGSLSYETGTNDLLITF